MNDRTFPKPLHLNPYDWARVQLDGPALRIEREGCSVAHLPLRRISRISASSRVHFNTDAILACADRGIVIVILDHSGDVMARIIGAGGARSSIIQRLHDLVERPDWKDHYETWKYAAERRICATLARRLHAPASCYRSPHQLDIWLERRIETFAGEHNQALTRNIFSQQARLWMQQHLLDQGLDKRNELWLTGFADLALDLGGLLAFRIESIRFGWLRGRAGSKYGRKPLRSKAVIVKSEQIQPRMARIGQDLLNRLHRWLVEFE